MQRSSHDIGDHGLQWVKSRSRTPGILDALVRLGRQTFGWFSKQHSRAFEYPWIITQIGRSPNQTVLDVGTGISPLPLYLAESGIDVVTLDHSAVHRQLGKDQHSWNGWGFLDYACLHPRLRSFNKDVCGVDFPAASFSSVYSVSVIEHMPSIDRRLVWEQAAKWLTPAGVLLLTLDLVPGTNRLWNQCQGKRVETPQEHGDLPVVERELLKYGFHCTLREFLRDLPDLKVDVAMLRFERI